MATPRHEGVEQMIFFEPGLYLRVQELENGPKPFPLQSGFTLESAYRALGLYNPSETSDAYFVLSNDRDEIWFICNRHLRTIAVLPDEHRLRLSKPVSSNVRALPANAVIEPKVSNAFS